MTRRRWIALAPLAAALVLGGPGARAWADDDFNTLVGKSGKVKQTNSETKTDFHIDVKSDVNIKIQGVMLNVNGGANVPPTTTTGGDGTTMQASLEWRGSSYGTGDVVSWSMTVLEPSFNKVEVTSRFTPPQSPTDIPSLGWNVTSSGQVFLLNTYGSAIHFDNLFFQKPATMTAASLLALLDAPPSGLTGLVTSGNVPAASGGVAGSLFVGQFPLAPGGFLTARMDESFVDSSFSPLTETGALGHQAIVPEPATLGLMLLGLGLAGAYTLQERGRRRPGC